MATKKKDPRNKKGQFTTEVKRTKVKSAAEERAKLEKSIAEREEKLREEGREQVRAKCISDFETLRRNLDGQNTVNVTRAYESGKLDGFQDGQAVGLKASGDARYHQGIELGVTKGFKDGVEVGKVIGRREGQHSRFVLGIVMGGFVVFIGGAIGVALFKLLP